MKRLKPYDKERVAGCPPRSCSAFSRSLLTAIRAEAGRHPVMEPEPEVRVNGFVISELWSRLEKREHYRRWMEGGCDE